MKKVIRITIAIILIIVLSFTIYYLTIAFSNKTINSEMLNEYLYNSEIDTSLYINSNTNKISFSKKGSITVYKIVGIENNLIILDDNEYILVIDDSKAYCSINNSYMFREGDGNV